MNSRTISKSLIPLASMVLCTSLAFAQQAPPPPPANAPAASAAPVERQAPPRPPMRPGMMRPGMMQQQPDNGPGNFRGAAMPDRGNMHGGFRGRQGGFHIGPQGMWWRNPRVVERLTLTPDQVKRMDGIFQESRLHLIDLRANVEKQEVMLEPLLSANPLDTAKAQAQIDKVADARADLEKANAKMLLGIRAVLTPDQWTRLRDRGQGAAAQSGVQPGGPGAPGGPGQPAAPADGQGRTRGLRPGGSGPAAPAPQQ
jgi:Spy/CpxP family protein refolding chaperone